ncbi:hypothetical protein Ddc_03221 [Ditylenchus destructor]|nr:hypothetical protein Ddc_03221 [Ditylenchus destructor]
MSEHYENFVPTDESIVQWEIKYAESEEKFARFQDKMREELDSKDLQIKQLKRQAKTFEEENETLRKQVESDQSKICHLLKEREASNDDELSIGEFDRIEDIDEIDNVRQELAEKCEAYANLQKELIDSKKLTEDLKQQLAQAQLMKATPTRNRLADSILHDSIFSLPKSCHRDQTICADGDYVVAQMMALLEELTPNRDPSILRQAIVNFLKDNGYEVSLNHVVDLEQSYRTELKKCRNRIRETNRDLAYEYRLDSSELAQQLAILSNDSIVTAYTNQPANKSRISLSMDLGKNISAMDIFNKTSDVTRDLGSLVSQISVLRNVCGQLFEKLRETAGFLRTLLDFLGESVEGRKLLDKINEIKLNLDRSVIEVQSLVEEVKKAESTIVDFRETLEQTLEQTQDVTTSQPLSGEVPKVDDSSAIQELKQFMCDLKGDIEASRAFVKKATEQCKQSISKASDYVCQECIQKAAEEKKEVLPMAADAILKEMGSIHETLSSASQSFLRVCKKPNRKRK